MWADSEFYRDSAPAGMTSKIAINPMAVALGTGTGSLWMLRQAGNAVQAAATADEALTKLPAVLRQAHATACDTSATPNRDGAYCLVGWSLVLGRVAGWIMRAPDFTPRLASQWSCPSMGAFDLVDDQDALDIAQRQLELVRREMPTASGGALILARITAGAITVRPAFDLLTGCRPVRARLSPTPAHARAG